MSMAISVAKTRHRGDSFLGDLGKFALGAVGGFVTGGPLGAAVGGLATVGGPKSTGEAVAQQQPGVAKMPKIPGITTPIPPAFPAPPGTFPSLPIPGLTTPLGPFYQPVETAQGTQLMCVNPNIRSTHVNKTSYFTKAGYVPKGTRCVANRRMNPLNPHAASRAMRRLSSAKKAAGFLSRITIRKAACGKGCK